MQPVVAAPLTSGLFDVYTYRAIIAAALGDWSPEDYVQSTAGVTPARNDLDALQFLGRCCLVSKEWCSLARPWMYRAMQIGESLLLS